MEDKLEITYKGEKRELFMSFLRLNSCIRMLGDVSNVAIMMVEPDLAENVLRVLLAQTAGPGAAFDLELGEEDVSVEDFDKCLIWAQDHLTSFFMKRFQQSQEAVEKLKPVIAGLVSQEPGSEA